MLHLVVFEMEDQKAWSYSLSLLAFLFITLPGASIGQ